MRTLQLAVFLALAMANATPAHASCTGADPSIVSAAVVNVTSANGLNTYRVSGRVRNVGPVKQTSSVLQFVGIYENDVRRDVRSVPPLKPNGVFTFTYDYARSEAAGAGTTSLTLRLYFRHPVPPGREDCNLDNDSRTLEF
ncbi:MAG: hypothetical protein M3M96_10475 [Candidatus Eremiobacteraeota bacterium]|nr:hypothetical protein [Candidatus Eremiobacteraeota bacterium]